MKQWTPDLRATGKPRYIAIADAIRADIQSGALSPGDRLPPQRAVAQELGVDFTTVSRGYSEAIKRGDIESFVGRGTFVRRLRASAEKPDPRRALEEDPMMNMPPEPDDPEVVARMQQGLAHVSANLVPLLRYQSAAGSLQDREMAAQWMMANGMIPDMHRLAITPGAHATVHAILTYLGQPGRVVLCDRITYPGIRAIAAQLGLRLVGLEMDAQGMTPEALDHAIQQYDPLALYLNPTLHNPVTLTMSLERRQQIAQVLARHGVPLIEDDAGAFVAKSAPPAISTLIPDLGWHIAGLSKCLGAGLRLALTTMPDGAAKGGFTQVLHTTHIMSSPISTALMSRWIEDGTAALVQTAVRKAAAKRQTLAAKVLDGCQMRGQDHAFNIWLHLPEGTNRAEVMGRMPNRQIGIMPSDAFTTATAPEEALRVCLGGPISLAQLKDDLHALREALSAKGWSG
jgi:DNA-binding transcriptional MocR family regulator